MLLRLTAIWLSTLCFGMAARCCTGSVSLSYKHFPPFWAPLLAGHCEHPRCVRIGLRVEGQAAAPAGIALAPSWLTESLERLRIDVEGFFFPTCHSCALLHLLERIAHTAVNHVQSGPCSLFHAPQPDCAGMMTGQILGGSDPAIAARYQIIIMLLIGAATGLASGAVGKCGPAVRLRVARARGSIA